MSVKKALLWVIFWVALALAFNVGIYLALGPEKALQFLGGYLIEQSLSLDNLFVFLMIFGSFGIPPVYQRRVLNFGIVGAIVLRLIFIVLGVAVVNRFHWVLYLFGFLLIASGLKMIAGKDEGNDFKNSRALKLLRKVIPVTPDLDGEKFFTRRGAILYATPLLAILILIESSDLIFAIDSIPAIFSVTTDPFIVYTSNIFAILGLRSMYFVLEKLHGAFRFVKYGVALILIFTGIKLAALMFHIEIPLVASILAIFGILLLAIVMSMLFKEAK